MHYAIRADYCAVALQLRAPRERVVAIVPVSGRGRNHLSQEDAARNVLNISVLPIVGLRQFLSRLGGVFLGREGARPPAGKVGVYLHGGHEYAAERDRAGLVLFLQTDGPVSRTNILGYRLDTPDNRGPCLGQTRASPA